MSMVIVVLDQRSPRGAAHDRAPPTRRASVDVHQTRAHARSREGFLVRAPSLSSSSSTGNRSCDLRPSRRSVTNIGISLSCEKPPDAVRFTCVGATG